MNKIIKEPIFIMSDNFHVYLTVAAAERNIEIYDVRECNKFCIDVSGQPLSVRINPRNPMIVQVVLAEDGTPVPDALAKLIRGELRWQRHYKKWSCNGNWLNEASLDELVAEVSRFARK